MAPAGENINASVVNATGFSMDGYKQQRRTRQLPAQRFLP
jgi:hypothetical protein